MRWGEVVQDPASDDWAGNLGTANVTLNADASATGKDTYKTVRVKVGKVWVERCWGGYWKNIYEYRTITIPGVSESYERNELTLSSNVDVHTNGLQTDGLSYTRVKATTTLDIDGVAWAKGTNGCPQNASIDVNGSITAYAYGNSLVDHTSGAFANAGGSGLTTVDFIGHEQDASNHGGWFSPNKASVDFHSTIAVDQKLFTASYVSKDGTTAANLAFVGGGNAELSLGADKTGFITGWVYDRDDIQLTGIHAAGKVSQSGRAIDGNAVAEGNSQASFNGANGSFETIPGDTHLWGCVQLPSAGMTANVGGYAVVTGYNNVSVQPNSITVTSVQHAKATTGNSGSVTPQ